MYKYVTEYDRLSRLGKALVWLHYMPLAYLAVVQWGFVGYYYYITNNPYYKQIYQTPWKAYTLGFVLIHCKAEMDMGKGITLRHFLENMEKAKFMEEVREDIRTL